MQQDHVTITLDYGDRITVEPDPDGEPAVKIENAAFVEAPRWLTVGLAHGHDRTQMINDMIRALTELRDTTR